MSRRDIKRDDSETYFRNKSKFLNDYDRSNPVTSKEAVLRHLESLENKVDTNTPRFKKYKKPKKINEEIKLKEIK